MTIYLNLKTPEFGTETVDEFTREPNQTRREFREYVDEMIANYRMAGMPVYRSSRACKDWRER